MANKLTKGMIDRAMPAERDYFIWDGTLAGFGVKICLGGRKSFICKYRLGTGRNAPTRRFTIGQYGSPWTVDTARLEARKILGRAAIGEDPMAEKVAARNRLDVAALCDKYLEEGIGTKKASTLSTDRGRIERHIKPLLGKKRVDEVTRADVTRFMSDIAAGKTSVDTRTGKYGRARVTGGKGTATRTVGLLGGIFTFAVDAGLLASNPVKGVKRYPDRRNERFLDDVEFQRLGDALAALYEKYPYAVSIIRLLAFTGARRGEIERLQWAEVDLQAGYLDLQDSKTGPKRIPLNTWAIGVLGQLPATDSFGYVFPALRGNGFYQGTPKAWRVIRARAQLSDARLHDLRHSYASIAVSQGASLPMIGGLLGHVDSATTQRYAHLQADPLRLATEGIGGEIARRLISHG